MNLAKQAIERLARLQLGNTQNILRSFSASATQPEKELDKSPAIQPERELDKSPAIQPEKELDKLSSIQPEAESDKLYKAVELELRGNDPAVLNSFAKFATMAGNHLDVKSRTWNSRKPNHERYTVLKAIHVQKKHRVQYEVRTYFTFVQYKYLTGSTVDTLLEYIERNLPEGVALKASKVELQRLPDYLTTPNTNA